MPKHTVETINTQDLGQVRNVSGGTTFTTPVGSGQVSGVELKVYFDANGQPTPQYLNQLEARKGCLAALFQPRKK